MSADSYFEYESRLVDTKRITIRQNTVKFTWFTDGNAMMTVSPALGGMSVDFHGHVEEFRVLAEEILKVANKPSDD